MLRKKYIEEKLQIASIEPGDKIKIITKQQETTGILMPHHQFSDKDILIIKLRNGYNIGVAIDTSTEVILLEKNEKIRKKAKQIPSDPNKPTISIVGMGGTIACYVDYRTGAVHPATSAQELAFSVPKIFDICNIKTKVVFQMLSEDIEVKHWQILARVVADELNNGAKGVVITHGTDTLGYTSAALSFMLKDLSGPVVLVGAQRSSDRPSSDAAQNLIAAVTLAAKSDIGEVVVVMHGETSDTYCNIHRGTKVRKLHTSRRDAFKTVNESPIGLIENGIIKIEKKYKKIKPGNVIVDDKIDKDVSIIYSYPSLKPEDIPHKKGIVILGTGLGHVSNRIIARIKDMVDKGTIFVMTSQCLFGRVNMRVYSTGRDIMKAGVIPGDDMLPETAYVKLMWVLGHENNKKKIADLMTKNIAGEITERTRNDVFTKK